MCQSNIKYSTKTTYNTFGIFGFRNKRASNSHGNKLIECAECHSSYHQECHTPPISDQDAADPRLIWYCVQCMRTMNRKAVRILCYILFFQSYILITVLSNVLIEIWKWIGGFQFHFPKNKMRTHPVLLVLFLKSNPWKVFLKKTVVFGKRAPGNVDILPCFLITYKNNDYLGVSR